MTSKQCKTAFLLCIMIINDIYIFTYKKAIYLLFYMETKGAGLVVAVCLFIDQTILHSVRLY